MNIYISNLSPNIDDNDLTVLFSEFGEITSARVIKDRETGMSKGFGFVVMPDDNNAKQAIENLNDGDYDGKTIRVSIARPRTEKPRCVYGKDRGYGNDRRNKQY